MQRTSSRCSTQRPVASGHRFGRMAAAAAGGVMFAAVAALRAVAADATPSAPDVPPGQQRTQKGLDGGPLQYWPNREDRAEVMTAGFLGGRGNEWLADGGFQADGSLVMAGNAIGGDFTLGVPVKTIGVEGPVPPPFVPRPLVDGRTREPVKDQTGQARYQPVKWTDDGVTGFLVRLAPGLDRITAACRLGWGTGAITACEVAPDGRVFIAGRAGPGAAQLARDADETAVGVEGIKGATCDRTFVAALAADLSRVLWVRVVSGPAFAPRLTLRRDGSLAAGLADLRTYDADGKLVSAVTVPGGLGARNSVSPLSGELVSGGEHNWSTGREPWRCPILNVRHPDGRLRYQFMDWGGPYVGLDGLRLVSDTAVRHVSHDRAGNILAILWSDGGNSVAHCQPTDVRRGVGTRGCGLTTAGAGATSFAYLMRIEPKDYQVIGWTLWCSQYRNKANGAGVARTGEADDGSTCFAGGSAWGLRQTANRLSATEPGGSYVAVLSPDLTGVRYASIVPGAGMAEVGDRCDWGIATGSPGGKGRAVFFCGAGKDGDNYGLVTPTPTVHALQPAFGGGIVDGWFLVLDLSKPTPEAVLPSLSRQRMTYEREARRTGAKAGRDEFDPADGTVFTFSPTFPKWVTVDAEFRHPDAAAFWPNFFYGRPVSGAITWRAGCPEGGFVVKCDKLVQPRGDQERRILGELIDAEAPPEVTLTVKSIGPLHVASFERDDGRGGRAASTVSFSEADAVLEIGGRAIDVRPRLTFRTGKVVEKSMAKLTVSAWLELTGRQLGMQGRAKDEAFDVRITAQAFPGGQPLK